MSDFFNKKNVKTRKVHKCEFCGKEIAKGEMYYYESGNFCGDYCYDCAENERCNIQYPQKCSVIREKFKELLSEEK